MLRAISTYKEKSFDFSGSQDISINANEIIVFNKSGTACLFDGEVIGPYEELRWSSTANQLVIYSKTVTTSALPLPNLPEENITLIIKEITFQQI